MLIEQIIAHHKKFIVITGGVCSSLGKGVLISSLGVLLKNAGYSVAVMKWDPYLNVDPGTMSPLQHGEVFVTSDGAETDLDLGHYERLIGIDVTRRSSITSGQIFEEILHHERTGTLLGHCIQMVPHVVDAIKQRLFTFALDSDAEFILIEIGGTVGDIEGELFLETIRQLRTDLCSSRMFHGHLGYVPFLSWTGEIKTKPTQHSVMQLKRAGITPDGLFLRADESIDALSIKKLSLMCGVPVHMIFQSLTFKPIYKLFIDLAHQGLGMSIQRHFGYKNPKDSDLSSWLNLIAAIEKPQGSIRVGLIAKYVGSNDPYISVIEAIKSAGYHFKQDITVEFIEAEQLEKEPYGSDYEAWSILKKLDGIVVPGGFDTRGIEGKILAARFAREHNIPYLGLCLGMQVMLIEAGRSLLGLHGAHSTEMNAQTPHPVVALLDEQARVQRKGASMRLGNYECSVVAGTKAHQAYGKETITERHRHRYEFNNNYRTQYEQAGVVFSGIFKEKDLVEIAELPAHRFMLGAQFHPEFTSSPLKINPLFKAFVESIVENRKTNNHFQQASSARSTSFS